MYDPTYHEPINPGDISISDESTYLRSFSGSDLIFDLIHPTFGSLIARGIGVSWNDAPQQFPVMEWGERKATEIVTGAQNVGTLQINSMYFLKMNDFLGDYSNLSLDIEYIGLVKISNQVSGNTAQKLKVLDWFIGLKPSGNSANFSAQQMYMRNMSFMYRMRLTGIQYKKKNGSSLYPATPSIPQG
jgi:hypothetical protein